MGLLEAFSFATNLVGFHPSSFMKIKPTNVLNSHFTLLMGDKIENDPFL
jgi:hypothetical protein